MRSFHRAYSIYRMTYRQISTNACTHTLHIEWHSWWWLYSTARQCLCRKYSLPINMYANAFSGLDATHIMTRAHEKNQHKRSLRGYAQKKQKNCGCHCRITMATRRQNAVVVVAGSGARYAHQLYELRTMHRLKAVTVGGPDRSRCCRAMEPWQAAQFELIYYIRLSTAEHSQCGESSVADITFDTLIMLCYGV